MLICIQHRAGSNEGAFYLATKGWLPRNYKITLFDTKRHEPASHLSSNPI